MYVKKFMKMVPKKFRKQVKDVMMLKFDQKPDYDGLIGMFKNKITTLLKKSWKCNEMDWVPKLINRSNNNSNSLRSSNKKVSSHGMSKDMASFKFKESYKQPSGMSLMVRE